MRRLIFTLVLTLFMAHVAMADENPVIIKLRSGVVVHGSIIKSNSDNTIDVRLESGDVFVYREDEVESIIADDTKAMLQDREHRTSDTDKQISSKTFNDLVVVTLSSGTELRGRIVKVNSDNTIELQLESGDIFVYRKNEVESIIADK